MPKILLTSFQPWLSHHCSNSSDDLLEKLENQQLNDLSLLFLRQLPVNISQAHQRVLVALECHQPHGVICCGMAEKRTHLSIESCAIWESKKVQTSVNLSQLMLSLCHTHLSHDAGKFVCEGLYYHVLKYCQSLSPSLPCLFVHVPLFTPSNTSQILGDFCLILEHFKASQCLKDYFA